MLLKGVAEAILLPPMLFLFLGVAGLLIARWYRRAGIVLAWFGMLGLLLLAVLGILALAIKILSPTPKP